MIRLIVSNLTIATRSMDAYDSSPPVCPQSPSCLETRFQSFPLTRTALKLCTPSVSAFIFPFVSI